MSTLVAAAAVFVWLGMVLAISFLEAPLKFTAPQVTTQIGLGIGRVVFRALNIAELILALVVGICLVIAAPSGAALIIPLLAVVVLVVQLLAVRPRLTRRSDAVLAGRDAPRSGAHHVYITFEVIKVISLIAAGIALLGA